MREVNTVNMRACLEHAGSKRLVLALIFSCKFARYRNVEESRIQVCALFWCLQRRCCCAVPTSYSKTCVAANFVGSCHYAAAFSLHVPQKCTGLDLTMLYILLWNLIANLHKLIASARRLLPAAMLERLPQVCRGQITFGLLLSN